MSARHPAGAEAPVLAQGNGHPAAPVLELKDVTKSYPAEPPVHALRGVDLVIRRGVLAAVVGRSSVPMMCSRVDLPDPDGPTTAASSPRRMTRSTPRRACTGGSAG